MNNKSAAELNKRLPNYRRFQVRFYLCEIVNAVIFVEVDILDCLTIDKNIIIVTNNINTCLNLTP